MRHACGRNWTTTRGATGRRAQAGFTIIELLSAMFVISVIAATLLPLLRLAHLKQAEAVRQTVAQQEAANALEKLSAVRWTELGADTGKDWKLSNEGAAMLPDGRLAIRLSEDAEDLPTRKAVVVVTWKPSSGTAKAKAQLTAWFPRPPEGSP